MGKIGCCTLWITFISTTSPPASFSESTSDLDREGERERGREGERERGREGERERGREREREGRHNTLK